MEIGLLEFVSSKKLFSGERFIGPDCDAAGSDLKRSFNRNQLRMSVAMLSIIVQLFKRINRINEYSASTLNVASNCRGDQGSKSSHPMLTPKILSH